MKIEIIKSTIVNKKGINCSVQPGDLVELDDQQADYLIGIGKAKVAPPAPVKAPAKKKSKKS
jgi:hypothetical protein